MLLDELGGLHRFLMAEELALKDSITNARQGAMDAAASWGHETNGQLVLTCKGARNPLGLVKYVFTATFTADGHPVSAIAMGAGGELLGVWRMGAHAPLTAEARRTLAQLLVGRGPTLSSSDRS